MNNFVVNCIDRCPAERRERTHHFAGNSSFCQAHAFEVLSLATSTYQQSIICMFHLSKFHTKQDFVFEYPAVLFTMLMGVLNCGSFIFHTLLLGTSKPFTLSVFLPGAHIHVLLPGTQQYL